MQPKIKRLDSVRIWPLTLWFYLIGLAAADWLPMPITKAYGFQICERKCALGDAACAAAVAVCETKINAYNIYMDQMGAGVSKHQLPAVYRDILGPRYQQTNFATYRFGFSDRQPPNNATTDCNTTYFNSASYVDALKNAATNSNWFWLLHEVSHTEQCTAVGGREGYGKRWWDELEAALAAQGTKVNFAQAPADLAKQMGTLFFQVHDSMPMEQQASQKAKALLQDLPKCCIAQGGKPIRPMTLTGIDSRSDAGSARLILTARVGNGDAPFTTRWWIKGPGDVRSYEQSQNLIRGLDLLWLPRNDPARAEVVNTATEQRRVWRYEIQVEVTQQSQLLDKKMVAQVFSTSDRVFVNLPKSTVNFDKLPAELPMGKIPGNMPTPNPGKPGPAPVQLPTKPPMGQ